MSLSVNISSYLKESLCHELEQEMNQQLLWELLETDVTSLNEVWHLDITKALQLQAASQKQDMTKIKLKKKKIECNLEESLTLVVYAIKYKISI